MIWKNRITTISLWLDGVLFKEWPFDFDTYFKGERNFNHRAAAIQRFISEKKVENYNVIAGRNYTFFVNVK